MDFTNVRGQTAVLELAYGGVVYRRASFSENDGGSLTCVYAKDGLYCEQPTTHLVIRIDSDPQWRVTSTVVQTGSWDDLLDASNRCPPKWQRREFCRTHAVLVAEHRNRVHETEGKT